QFNALFDNSTMRDPETGKASTSIGMDEYVKPESIFLDIETLRDVTADEFRYILGNILRSTRYGAISSRIGKVKNIVAGIVFSDCELFSNLELTQSVYDLLREGEPEPDFPLAADTVVTAVNAATETLAEQVVGQLTIVPSADLHALISEIGAFYRDGVAVTEMLENTSKIYGAQG
ncbi:MAG: type I-D CRISPR-associated protein Cas7/Csc2, partial [Caldilineaceae bacterium]|nr:type I-D CRISPR-associated protein Cas7/Csc2 [Caldilineaceae bacterium]